MGHLRYLVLLLAIAVLMWFFALNANETVTVKLTPKGNLLEDVPLILAVAVAFFAGAFAWFLVTLFQDLRLRQDLRRARKDTERLREELKALRNLPVEDIEESGDVLEPEETLTH